MSLVREKRGPKPQPAEYRADYVIRCRVTRAERELTERLARRDGTTRSEVIRSAIEEYHLRSDC